MQIARRPETAKNAASNPPGIPICRFNRWAMHLPELRDRALHRGRRVPDPAREIAHQRRPFRYIPAQRLRGRAVHLPELRARVPERLREIPNPPRSVPDSLHDRRQIPPHPLNCGRVHFLELPKPFPDLPRSRPVRFLEGSAKLLHRCLPLIGVLPVPPR